MLNKWHSYMCSFPSAGLNKTSAVQVALYENIEKYLKSGTSGLEGYFTGQVLCIVALICWYLMVAKEAGGEHLLETVARATIPSFDHL